jgi:hypothetical protein
MTLNAERGDAVEEMTPGQVEGVSVPILRLSRSPDITRGNKRQVFGTKGNGQY